MLSKKKFYTIILVGLLLLIGLGYAYIHTDLSINGDALFKRATWNIHFVSPPTVTNGSVTGTNVTTPAQVVGTNNDTVNYSVTLTNPKDFYEFTVTVQNEGTMDGMISVFSNKVYSGNTEITLPDYVKSEVTYSSGAKVKQKQLLQANTTETFKVKVYYRDDIETSELPGVDTALSFMFNVTYVQADNEAIEVLHPSSFSTDNWQTIASNIDSDVYQLGDTKEIDLGTLGTHTLRIANKSTPAECEAEGFSQTACGFVVEFADIINLQRMNPYNMSATTTIGNGSIGGWPET